MIQDPFSGKLLPGERIAWSGRPRQGVFFSPRDLMLIPFTLMWGGFAVLWEILALRASPLMAIWGVPFVLVGLFAVSGRFLADSYVRSQLFYAVTGRRALIARLGRFPAFTSLNLETLQSISLEGGSGGSGTIYLGPRLPVFGRNAALGLMPSLGPTPAFLAIQDAAAVLALLSAHESSPQGNESGNARLGSGLVSAGPAPRSPAAQSLVAFGLLVPAIMAGLIFSRAQNPFGATGGGVYHAVRSIAVTEAAYDRGERNPVDRFASDDTVMVLLVLNWPDKWRSQGFHNIVWNWNRDGQAVFTTRYSHMNFSDSPFTLRTWRSARALGSGHFRVDTVIDGKTAGAAEFDVDVSVSGKGQGGL